VDDGGWQKERRSLKLREVTLASSQRAFLQDLERRHTQQTRHDYEAPGGRHARENRRDGKESQGIAAAELVRLPIVWRVFIIRTSHHCFIRTNITDHSFLAAVIQPTLPELSSARNTMPPSSKQPVVAASKQQVAPYEPDAGSLGSS
jgi:hypothetical protein